MMIEYEFIDGLRGSWKVTVRLDGKVVGAIKIVEGGFAYFPKGSKQGFAGEVFKSVREAQQSLEETAGRVMMASQFAVENGHKIARLLKYYDGPPYNIPELLDAELAEVRAVLSLTADRRYPKHGHCWCRKDLTDDSEPHGKFCQRARVLYGKLAVK